VELGLYKVALHSLGAFFIYILSACFFRVLPKKNVRARIFLMPLKEENGA